LDRRFGPFGLQIADLAEECTDAGALGEDLAMGGVEGVLGTECPLAPGRLAPVVLVADCLTSAVIEKSGSTGV
jgi:hypothetical protein